MKRSITTLSVAARSANLLDAVVQGRPLVQWEHHPADDVDETLRGLRSA
jgi:hypothetical protein